MNIEKAKQLCDYGFSHLQGTNMPQPIFFHKEDTGRTLFIVAWLAAPDGFNCWAVDNIDPDKLATGSWDMWHEEIFRDYGPPNLLETEEHDYLIGLDWKLFNERDIKEFAKQSHERIDEFINLIQ